MIHMLYKVTYDMTCMYYTSYLISNLFHSFLVPRWYWERWQWGHHCCIGCFDECKPDGSALSSLTIAESKLQGFVEKGWYTWSICRLNIVTPRLLGIHQFCKEHLKIKDAFLLLAEQAIESRGQCGWWDLATARIKRDSGQLLSWASALK